MKYNKIHSHIFETLRCSPILFDFIFLTLYSISNKKVYLKMLFIKLILVVLNKFIKDLFRRIFLKFGTYKNKGYYLPILGRGDRPYGAKNCGLFNDCSNKLSKSHGFPSGHAQSAANIFILMNLIIKNPNHKIIVFIFTIFISLARIYEKCHTIQQVIAGYIIGIFLTKRFINIMNIKKDLL